MSDMTRHEKTGLQLSCDFLDIIEGASVNPQGRKNTQSPVGRQILLLLHCLTALRAADLGVK